MDHFLHGYVPDTGTRKGYAVHSNVLNKWKRFQRAAAQNWRMPQDASNWQIWQSELQQAFRLYTLALAGAPEYGAMNRMKEQPGLSIKPNGDWQPPTR